VGGPAGNKAELTVGQLAARSGVAVSALHFYERQGLITSRRTSGNQRRYPRDVLRRVALVRIAQRVGIPLADVAAALALLPDGRTPTRDDWGRLSRHWQADLDERMRQLQQLRDAFVDCVGCGCLSIDRCRLANPYDALGAQGPGPRRLPRSLAGPTAPADQGVRRPNNTPTDCGETSLQCCTPRTGNP
jgi:MerR family transcriptional regulator, redox-sensitive transcriptional activator SoxR